MKTYEEIREACAEAAHAMNAVYCRALGDDSQVDWHSAALWQKDSARKGVDGVFAGNGPEKSHEGWLEEKRATGWKWGAVKDSNAKTHPCFVPYAELPPEQKQKDFLFVSTVKAMAYALGGGQVPSIAMHDELKVTTRPAP